MFTELLGQHFVHTALMAGAVVAVVSGAIGTFVVTRGASFAVHAVSELGFTGAAGALVLGIDPVAGMIAGSLLVGGVLGLLSLRGRERAVELSGCDGGRHCRFLSFQGGT